MDMKLYRNISSIFFIFTLVIIPLIVSSCGIFHKYADCYRTAFCYKGRWSSWTNHYFPSPYMRDYDDWKIRSSNAPNGDIIGLSISDRGDNVYYRFKIDNYTRGQKQFTGTVEYYVNDDYPTADALAKACHFVCPNPRTDQTPSVKRIAKATIKIVNDERRPQVFNLWYDDIGVGISVRNVRWYKE